MANKFCTSCGSPISENMKFCGQCGAPVDQAVPVAQVISQATDVPAAPAKSHKKLFIGLGIGAGVIIAAIIILIVILTSGNYIAMPYGIDPDMTGYEVQDQMIASGFVRDFGNKTEDRTTVFYNSSLVLGYKTDFTSLYVYDDGHYVDITHHFDDPGYGEDNESAKFEKVKQRLTEEHGKPELGDTMYKWVDGIYSVYLYYYGTEGDFCVVYQYNTHIE